MAIQITKMGVLPGDKKFKGTCHNCKTEFTCLRSDGRYTDSQRDGSFLTVDCPLCSKAAYAYELKGGDLIPEHMRNSWEQR